MTYKMKRNFFKFFIAIFVFIAAILANIWGSSQTIQAEAAVEETVSEPVALAETVETYYWWVADIGGKTTLTISNTTNSGYDSITDTTKKGELSSNATHVTYLEIPWYSSIGSIQAVIVDGNVAPTNTNNWFSSMSILESVDLSGLNGTNIENMGYMFSSCSTLTSVIFGSGFTPTKVSNMNGMFSSCSNLSSVTFQGEFSSSIPVDMGNMFFRCYKLISIDFSKFSMKSNDMSKMFYECSSLTSVTFGDYFDTTSVTDMSYMFYKCSSLTSVTLGDNFDTSSVTNMNSMFYKCSSLTSVTFGNNFDTSSVTDMSYMFQECSKLESITFGEHFNTSEACNMCEMFRDCYSLTTIDFSKFNMKSSNMYYMFYRCSSLTSVKFGDNFDTSSVTDMSVLFSSCSKLKSVTFGEKFKTTKVTTMNNMFSYCDEMTSVTFGNNFDTSSVTDMSYMFSSCDKLKSITFGEGFKTSAVTNMNRMFEYCSNLETLDLRNFVVIDNAYFNNVLANIFTGSGSYNNLKTITLSSSVAQKMCTNNTNNLSTLYSCDESTKLVTTYEYNNGYTGLTAGTYYTKAGKPTIVAQRISTDGTFEYADFAKAFETATTAGTATIKMLTDTTISSTLTVGEGQDITLDLNDKVLTYTGTTGSIFVIENGGSFTLNDNASSKTSHILKEVSVRGGVLTGGKGTVKDTALLGGAFYVKEGGTLTMNDGNIFGNSAKNDANTGHGGGMRVMGTLIMNGGKILYNESNCGGGICICNGTVEISDGSIEFNTSTCDGGGIFTENNSTDTNLIMTGGYIQENKSEDVGAGVRVSSGGFDMSGGSITNNKVSDSTKNGGGIYVDADSDNKSNASLILSGQARVTENHVGTLTNNVFLASGKIINIKGAFDYGLIGISGSANQIFTSNYGNYYNNIIRLFRPDNQNNKIYYSNDGNELVLGKRVTELTIEGNPNSISFPKKSTFKLTATILPSDAWINTVGWTSSAEDVAIVSQNGVVNFLKPGTVTITASADGVSETCTITATPSVYTVTYYDGNVEITSIESQYLSYTYGTGLTLPNAPTKTGHTFNGWYDNNTFTGENMTNITTTDDGNKVFYADYGEHTWETRNNESQHWQVCVCGEQTEKADHSSTEDYNCTTPLKCTVCNYVITAAKASHEYEYTSLNSEHKGSCKHVDCKATLTEFHTYDESTGNCPICNTEIVVIVTTDKEYYYADFAEGWNAAVNNSSVDNPAEVKLLKNIIADSTTHSFGTGKGFGAGEANSTGYILVPASAHINLDLNGYKIDRNLSSAIDDGFVIQVNGYLILTDTNSSGKGNGVVCGGNNIYTGGGVYVSRGGTFIMNGGKISGNTATNGGGGVYVYGNTASDDGSASKDSFIMNDGIISGNTAGSGAGVSVIYCIFKMNGGKISGNTVTSELYGGHGGGVCIGEHSTFTMNGGTIGGSGSDKNTAKKGGGVYFIGRTFTMKSGATITGNTAIVDSELYGGIGGGVYFDGETFTMESGATITGNTSEKEGGGIFVADNGTFTMNGGTISDNTATSNGGGIYVGTDGTFIMSNGTISGNTANSNGGGVYVDGGYRNQMDEFFLEEYNGGTFEMNGGNIVDNTASYGGGVYVTERSSDDDGGNAVKSGSLTMSGGTISGNAANTTGGGVYVEQNCTFKLSGNVSIIDNILNNDSNSNIYITTSSTNQTKLYIDGNLAEGSQIGIQEGNVITNYKQSDKPSKFIIPDSSSNNCVYVSDETSGDVTIGTHSGGTATCTEKAVCTYCKESYGKVDDNNHSYGDVTYTWAVNNSTCTAKRICTRSGCNHEDTENGTITSVTTAPTCTADGYDTLTATFTNTAFTAQTKQANGKEALNHSWGTPTYTWAEDNSTCTAKRICTRSGCNHEETETATASAPVTTAPTCTTGGYDTLTATFTNTAFTVQTKQINKTDALGHSWGTPTYTWAADNSTCTAKRICSRTDCNHEETENGIITSVTTAPTCTADGYDTLTATFTNTAFTVQTKQINQTDALGHSWGTPTYTWAADNSTCTAKRICTRTDCNHEETENGTITSVTTAPTCTADGYDTLTATFTNTAFTVQTKQINQTDALGHSWDEGIVTTDPTCTEAGVKTFTCSVCNETRTESVAAAHTLTHVDKKNPTVEADGNIEYWNCSVCQKKFLDDGAVNEVDDVIIPKLVAELVKPDEKGEENEVVVTTPGGFAPDVELVVTEKEKEDNEVYETIAETVNGEVDTIYSVSLKSDGVSVQPDGTVTVKMRIPENLVGENFHIFHLHEKTATDLEYKVEGNYAVVTTDSLFDFIFVREKSTFEPIWLILIIVVSLVIVGEGGFITYRKVRKNKEWRNQR